MSKPQYPFSAVCGQDDFKLALMLAAINPAMGGVVISGPRGSAKSTLARGMADLLEQAEFVTLPLGASEEMLLGTLDLQQVLNDKQMQFSPGLLSKAHQGVLYVDEVNLLADNLVDLLLDVATSGVNQVERDGISHSHASEFILVGTMNPDEGELRPQLHDRFGLSVQLSNHYPAQQRVEIVKRREQFDSNPHQFVAGYELQQQQLVSQIQKARCLLPEVTCLDELRLAIAERCEAAQVDGLRADIVWFQAAKAHASLEGRDEIHLSDIDAVEELVLNHRRKAESQPPTPPNQDNSGSSQETKQEPNQQQNDNASSPFKRPDASRKQQPNQNAGQGEWGAMTPEQSPERQKTAQLKKMDLTALVDQSVSRDSVIQMGAKKVTHEKTQRPDWFKTLVNNLPSWPPKSLQFKAARKDQERLHLVLLDTSASTLQAKGFAMAKAALLQVSEQAYLKREKIAVFGFGNNQVDHLLSCVRAPKALNNWLDNLGAGGGTPMRDVFVKAQSYIERLQKQNSELEICCYVLSDGRSSSSLQGIELNGDRVWIDTEMSNVKRGRGQQLAQQIQATYLSLSNYLSSPSGISLVEESSLGVNHS